MSRRGFFGPFRCCLCYQDGETSDHIFVGCIFTQKAWAHILSGLPVSSPSNIELVILFANWNSRYPWILSTSHEWRKIWQAIPKFLWWKFWLARNDLIFNSKVTKPYIVATKVKDLLLEVVGNTQIDANKFKAEHNWLGSLQADKIQCGSGSLLMA